MKSLRNKNNLKCPRIKTYRINGAVVVSNYVTALIRQATTATATAFLTEANGHSSITPTIIGKFQINKNPFEYFSFLFKCEVKEYEVNIKGN